MTPLILTLTLLNFLIAGTLLGYSIGANFKDDSSKSTTPKTGAGNGPKLIYPFSNGTTTHLKSLEERLKAWGRLSERN
jgi:hypothetical protein